MNNNSIKTVVATGIGAALFIIIGMFVNIPIFGNTSIQLQYAVQALFSAIYGPIAGFFIGFIGHALKDGIQYGSISWAWVLGSGVIGLVIGLLRKKFDISKGSFSLSHVIWFNIAQILALLIAYGIITPLGDKLQYAQAWSYLYAQSAVAGLANALTIGFGGTILLAVYAKSRTQSGSLSKD
ncbi:ECF-type riboflavin transporter substrate-binding protein [Streptococcus dentiloxodontae]